MYTYPFDPLGNNSENDVLNEEHQLTVFNSHEYYFIIPIYAPFFGCSINVTLNGNELSEGTDYTLIMPFVSATRSTGIPMYSGISFNNHLGATVAISYHTLGGIWVNDTLASWKLLAERTYNPRHIYYDQILCTPEKFPPMPHSVKTNDFYEFGVLLHEMGKISKAIAAKETPSHIMEYLINTRSNRYSNLEQQIIQLNARLATLEE